MATSISLETFKHIYHMYYIVISLNRSTVAHLLIVFIRRIHFWMSTADVCKFQSRSVMRDYHSRYTEHGGIAYCRVHKRF